MADIISLAEARAARAAAKPRADMSPEAERLLTFQLLDQIRRNLGLAPDYRGDFVVVRRRPAEEAAPQPQKSLIHRRIEEAAMTERPFVIPVRLGERPPQGPPIRWPKPPRKPK